MLGLMPEEEQGEGEVGHGAFEHWYIGRKKAERARAQILVKLTPLLVRCGAETVALYFRAWRRRTQLSRPGAATRTEASVQVLRRMARRGSISAAFVLWRRAWLQGAVSAGPASPHALAYAADY